MLWTPKRHWSWRPDHLRPLLQIPRLRQHQQGVVARRQDWRQAPLQQGRPPVCLLDTHRTISADQRRLPAHGWDGIRGCGQCSYQDA